MKRRGVANMLWGNVKIPSGLNGKSAYEIAVANGFIGTEAEWLASLQGDDGHTPYISGGYWWINGTNTGIPATGVNGRGISGVVLHSTVGKVKTYRMTFTDATYFDYEVTDGEDGAGGGSDTFQIDFIFDGAGTITYPCAYALKWTAMIHQQTNAPTLSHALNTDLAQYTNFTVTADAPGIITLTGVWL